jgi:hypothetical protein
VREVPKTAEPMREVVTSPDDESPQMRILHKRKPAWARELIQDGEKYGVPEGTTRQVKRPKPFFGYMALICDLLEEEPTCLKKPLRGKNGQMS